MARPIKSGLDYFPMDVGFFSDPKIKKLKGRYGSQGISVYIYLVCEIYKEGYYMLFDDDMYDIIADDLHLSVDLIRQVMQFLCSRSLLTMIKLAASDTYITSRGIQRRYQTAIKERARKKGGIEVDEKFWLLKEEESESFIKCTNFSNYSSNNGSFSGNNSNNSKKNETKEKERKEKESRVEETKEKESREAFGIKMYGHDAINYYKQRVMTYYHTEHYDMNKVLQFLIEDKKNRTGFFK